MTQECFAYSDCPNITTAECSDCFSGQLSCLDDLVCNQPGICQGPQIDHEVVNNVDECIEFCRSNDNCQWYTFFPDTGTCSLTDNCVDLDDECEECITGQKHCSSTQLSGIEKIK